MLIRVTLLVTFITSSLGAPIVTSATRDQAYTGGRHGTETWAGYVLIKEESFTGKLSGSKFAYEYTRGGKPMVALIDYLEADNRTIFSLLFRGPRNGMENLRNQADSIARSFRLKRSTPSRN